MSLKFQRKIEDFKCLNCGAEVKGDGFTNHCPACLWSRHVDINPGDRAEKCSGLMEPIGVELENGKYQIIHKCIICNLVRKNKARNEDDISGFLTSMVL